MGSISFRGELKDGQKCALTEEFGGTKLAHKITNRGRHVWQVRRTDAGELYIALSLLETSRGEVHVKSMSECEGPFYYDCPLEFLAMVPEANPKSGWRTQVLAYHARCNAEHMHGDPMVVYGRAFKFYGPAKGAYFYGYDANTKKYRFKKCDTYTAEDWAAERARRDALGMI